MATAKAEGQGFRLPIFQGILPIDRSTVPADILAGMTLAALGHSVVSYFFYATILGVVLNAIVTS